MRTAPPTDDQEPGVDPASPLPPFVLPPPSKDRRSRRRHAAPRRAGRAPRRSDRPARARRSPRRLLTIVAGVLAVLALSPAAAADAEHGKALYQACVACHTEGSNSLGPSLKGVFGRKSGSLEDFRYSNAMQRANLVWDEGNLKSYLADPQGKVKGNRMPYGGLTDANDVEDIIAYLKLLQ